MLKILDESEAIRGGEARLTFFSTVAEQKREELGHLNEGAVVCHSEEQVIEISDRDKWQRAKQNASEE